MVYILHDKIHNTAAAVCIITEQINYVDFLIFLYRGLFGSGSSNSLATYNLLGRFFELVPLQLPRTGARAIELATRIADVLHSNCWTFGLSFVARHCRFFPKNCSSKS